MISRVTLLPSARRMMDSLRGVGHDVPSAIAEIVDNSIAAGARHIDVDFVFDGADSWIRMVDDGVGMGASILEEAMRYGTQRSYAAGELGRFGLGLKTASLSQCRRLTVASRRAPERCRVEIRQWDLDHVARTNRWEALKIDASHAPAELVAPLQGHTGTVVLWEGLDRILEYKLPGGAAARGGFATLAVEVGAHIAMVFHRFLSGETRSRKRLDIRVNGQALRPWDPYARREPHTRVLPRQVIGIPTVRGRPRLIVQPYLLPSQERFSSSTAHVGASGPHRWNRQQGFYFYRNDRLIQTGGWNRLRTMDEHTKLARIAVDIPTGCDELFGVNVTKMRISLPASVREGLTAIASGVAAEAGAAYRARSQRTPTGGTHGVVELAVPSLISTLTTDERSLLEILIDLVRDEFRNEPDMLRRLLSRIERLPGAVRSSSL